MNKIKMVRNIKENRKKDSNERESGWNNRFNNLDKSPLTKNLHTEIPTVIKPMNLRQASSKGKIKTETSHIRIKSASKSSTSTKTLTTATNSSHHIQAANNILLKDPAYLQIKSLWDSLGVTNGYRRIFDNVSIQLASVYREGYFSNELSQLQKISDLIQGLKKDITDRQNRIEHLKKFDKYISIESNLQNNQIPDKVLNDIINCIKELRIVSIRIVKQFIKIRKNISYDVLCGKFEINRIKEYNKNYMIIMKNDTDFLATTYLSKYFNFASESDPFLTSLSENINKNNTVDSPFPYQVPIDEDMVESVKNSQYVLLREMINCESSKLFPQLDGSVSISTFKASKRMNTSATDIHITSKKIKETPQLRINTKSPEYSRIIKANKKNPVIAGKMTPLRYEDSKLSEKKYFEKKPLNDPYSNYIGKNYQNDCLEPHDLMKIDEIINRSIKQKKEIDQKLQEKKVKKQEKEVIDLDNNIYEDDRRRNKEVKEMNYNMSEDDRAINKEVTDMNYNISDDDQRRDKDSMNMTYNISEDNRRKEKEAMNTTYNISEDNRRKEKEAMDNTYNISEDNRSKEREVIDTINNIPVDNQSKQREVIDTINNISGNHQIGQIDLEDEDIIQQAEITEGEENQNVEYDNNEAKSVTKKAESINNDQSNIQEKEENYNNEPESINKKDQSFNKTQSNNGENAISSNRHNSNENRMINCDDFVADNQSTHSNKKAEPVPEQVIEIKKEENKMELPSARIRSKRQEVIPKVHKEFFFEFFSGTFDELSNIYALYITRVHEDQITAFNLSMSVECYIKGVFPKVLFVHSELHSDEVKGVITLSYDNTSQFALKLNITSLSSIVNEELEDILLSFIKFSNEQLSFDEMHIEFYYGMKDGQFYLIKFIEDILKTKAKFKWVNMENDGRIRKINYKYNNPGLLMSKDSLARASVVNKDQIVNALKIKSCSLTALERKQYSKANYDSLIMEGENEINDFPLMCLFCEMISKYKYTIDLPLLKGIKFDKLRKLSKEFILTQIGTGVEINEFIQTHLSSILNRVNSKMLNEYFLCCSILRIDNSFENIASTVIDGIVYNQLKLPNIEVFSLKNDNNCSFDVNEENESFYLVHTTNENCSLLIYEIVPDGAFSELLDDPPSEEDNLRIYEAFKNVYYKIDQQPNETKNLMYLPSFSINKSTFLVKPKSFEKLTISNEETDYKLGKLTQFETFSIGGDSSEGLIWFDVNDDDIVIKSDFIIAVINHDLLCDLQIPTIAAFIVKKENWIKEVKG